MRPVDWSPLGLGGDPVPGDPDQVAVSGREYNRVADAIETAMLRLDQIVDKTDMVSKAVSEFRDKARQVSSDVRRAKDRYRGVGQALVVYSTPLHEAQAETASALAAAVTAQHELDSAQGVAQTRRDQVAAAAQDADVTDLQRQVGQADAASHEAAEALRRAKARCQDAVDDRDRAARTAITAIQEVQDSGDINDSWWDNWGSKVVHTITTWAGRIATVAGILALCVGWIPVIGQALAAVLGTVALIASVISLVGNLALYSQGETSLQNVIFDAISVATFGVGRAVIGGARGAMAATKGGARLAAGRMAAQAPAVRAARGLSSAPGSRSAINGMIGSELGALSRNGARTLLQRGMSVPRVSLMAPLRAAASDTRALGANLRVGLSPANIGRGLGEVPAFAAALKAAPASRRVSMLLGDAETLAHQQVLSSLPVALRGMTEVSAPARRAAQAVAVGVGAQGVSSALDGYQGQGLFQELFGPPSATPRKALKLPELEPAGVR